MTFNLIAVNTKIFKTFFQFVRVLYLSILLIILNCCLVPNKTSLTNVLVNQRGAVANNPKGENTRAACSRTWSKARRAGSLKSYRCPNTSWLILLDILGTNTVWMSVGLPSVWSIYLTRWPISSTILSSMLPLPNPKSLSSWRANLRCSFQSEPFRSTIPLIRYENNVFDLVNAGIPLTVSVTMNGLSVGRPKKASLWKASFTASKSFRITTLLTPNCKLHSQIIKLIIYHWNILKLTHVKTFPYLSLSFAMSLCGSLLRNGR